MLTHWVDQTWRELHKENFNLIRQTFRKLSLFLTINESKDKELWIKNSLNVEVENWRLSIDQSNTKMKALNDFIEMNETDSVEMNETNEIEMMKKKYVLKKKNQSISIDESERDNNSELENEKEQK